MYPPTETGVAARLKAETRQLHTLAERSGVMADLLQGRFSLGAYCALLRNLQAIYAALEAGLDKHPTDARLWRQQLRRWQALAQDLACLDADARSAEAPLAQATVAYRARLVALAQTEPVLLLAHASVRYLGDLHGGQMLARLVRQRFGLDGPGGTDFYAFGDAAQVEALKRDLRVGLDALALSPQQTDAFVAEACQAFRRHQQLFEELQACCTALGAL